MPGGPVRRIVPGAPASAARRAPHGPPPGRAGPGAIGLRGADNGGAAREDKSPAEKHAGEDRLAGGVLRGGGLDLRE